MLIGAVFWGGVKGEGGCSKISLHKGSSWNEAIIIKTDLVLIKIYLGSNFISKVNK